MTFESKALLPVEQLPPGNASTVCCVQNLENQGITDMPAGWTITISNPAYMRLNQAWNWECSHLDSTGTAWGQATQVRFLRNLQLVSSQGSPSRVL